ncbi:MAG: hypothetical protein DMF04_08790 [Verrucomicrobia bacterium]|nr:MAG: hypothetical protein DMF04_08790 [Verrucomicrobiota bacterium]
MISRRVFAFLGAASVCLSSMSAAQREQARVTEVVRDVRVLPGQGAASAANLNDSVTDGSVVHTGAASRVELTCADFTITRVGANSVFTFDRAGRNVDVESGAILLRVPKASGVARIRSSALIVRTTGTTLMFEFRPRDYAKLIILEGSSQAWLSTCPANKIRVHGGQMLVVKSDATRLPEPVDIDLDRLLRTAVLITEFPPLPSLGLIRDVADNQTKLAGPLLNPFIDPTGMGARDVNASTQSESKPQRIPNPGRRP